MNFIYKNLFLTFLFLFTKSGHINATNYFKLDFESGKQPQVEQPSPVWSLPNRFANNYGTGNFFEVTDKQAHSGNYSLRFNYQGKNNFCNMCGVFRSNHKSGLDGVDYFVDDGGKDLTRLDVDKKKKAKKKMKKKEKKKPQVKITRGPAAEPGKIIFNKSNGFSKWQITAVESKGTKNDKLSLRLLKEGITGKKAEFNSDDKIAIARQCDVDGHVGRTVNRRSDCDMVITWLKNVNKQKPGTSIFRRVYLRPENISSGVHQKLHYLRIDNKDAYKRDVIVFADSRESETLIPIIVGFRKNFGGAPIYKPGKNGLPGDLEFKDNTWYYMEEQYKASTLNEGGDVPYNDDGEYRLWLAEAGKEKMDGTTPALELTGLTLPSVNGGIGYHISLWGNVQHFVDIEGYWYMDDIRISDAKIGMIKTTHLKN